jgi:hypothetical protein
VLEQRLPVHFSEIAMSKENGSGWTAHAENGVIYMRLEGALTRAVVDATRRLQVAALAQRPSGIGILLDVGTSPTLPPAEVREYAASVMAKYPDGVLAHATILSGRGFLASATRSALTGIFLLGRNAYPRTVVATPVEGIRFLRGHLGKDPPDESGMLRTFLALPELEPPGA